MILKTSVRPKSLKRIIVVSTLLAFALLLLVGCTAAPAAPAASGTEAGAAASSEPKELSIIYVGSEPKLLDAQVDPFDSAAVVSSWLAATLVSMDLDKSFQPYLAESWEVSEDGTVWTFKLREDVTFHDGTPLNADAVKFNFDRILDPATQSGQSAAMLGPIVSTEVVDEFTFRVTHATPWARFLDALAEGFIAIWSPTAVQEYGVDFQQHLVGAGPFMLTEYVPADHSTLVKNPDYNWAPAFMEHQGPAMIDKVTLRFISEAATAVAAFQAGEADIVIRFPPARVPEFRGDDSIVLQEGQFTGSPVNFVINTAEAPLDDLNVRKALRHAINQDEIIQVLWAGEAIATKGIMYPASLCYWPDAETAYPFDLDAANALLEEAGWVDSDGDGIREKDGQPLTLTLVNAFVDTLGPIVQAQLKLIGVDAQIELVPGPVQLEKAASGEFDTIFQHMAAADPGVLDMLYNSANLKPGGWSWSRYQNPELDEILNESATTVDVEARCALLTEAQKIISDEVLALPLYGNKWFAAMTPEVKGFGAGPRPNVDIWLYNTSLE